jgi:XRE family transcriptional regulator of biofilm formation
VISIQIPNGLGMSLGERIRERRSAQGLSTYRLAAAAGITRAYIVCLEQGVRDNPTLQTLCRIAGALDTSVCYLIGDTDDPTPTKKDPQA